MCHEKGVKYLDVYSEFLDADNNRMSDCFLEDGVHLSPKGYEIWAGLVELLLAESAENGSQS